MVPSPSQSLGKNHRSQMTAKQKTMKSRPLPTAKKLMKTLPAANKVLYFVCTNFSAIIFAFFCSFFPFKGIFQEGVTNPPNMNVLLLLMTATNPNKSFILPNFNVSSHRRTHTSFLSHNMTFIFPHLANGSLSGRNLLFMEHTNGFQSMRDPSAASLQTYPCARRSWKTEPLCPPSRCAAIFHPSSSCHNQM